MKSTESVIASMKVAAEKFVVTNRKQLIATLPKDERPVRKAKVVAKPTTLQGALQASRLLSATTLRRITAQHRELRVTVEGNVVKLVNRKHGFTVGTITVELGANSRKLKAELVNYSDVLRPFKHTYGLNARYSTMLRNMDVVPHATLAQQARSVRQYIQDDVDETMDDMLVAYGELRRKHKEAFEKEQARIAKIKATPAYKAKYGNK